LVAPHPERADAELYPGLGLVDLPGQVLDEAVDVAAPPVALVHAAAVGLVGGLVGELAALGVAVDVVAEVCGVDAVLPRDVHAGLGGRFPHFGDARVVPHAPAVLADPAGVLAGGALGVQLGRVVVAGDPVRVEPGVELQVAGVGLLEHEVQHVVAGVLAGGPGDPRRPRLDRGVVERVGVGADLHEHRVHVHLPRGVEEPDELLLLLVGGGAGVLGPVDVADGGDPHGAQLARAGVAGRGDVGALGAGAAGDGRGAAGAPALAEGGQAAAGQRARRDQRRRSSSHLESPHSAPIVTHAGRCYVRNARRPVTRRAPPPLPSRPQAALRSSNTRSILDRAAIVHAFESRGAGVRWDHLLLDGGGPPGGSPGGAAEVPLIERRAVARTVDSPEFRGMTFYEVHARTVINKVPEASRVPFRWTINPYR